MLGDLLDWNESIKSWKSIERNFTMPQCENAYKKLVENIDLSKAVVLNTTQKCTIFVHEEGMHNGSHIFMFKVKAREVDDSYRMGNILTTPLRTYRLHENRLLPMLAASPQEDSVLKHCMVGIPKPMLGCGTCLSLIDKLEDDIVVTEGYEWSNGKPIFGAMSKMFKEIPKGKEKEPHIGLHVNIK